MLHFFVRLIKCNRHDAITRTLRSPVYPKPKNQSFTSTLCPLDIYHPRLRFRNIRHSIHGECDAGLKRTSGGIRSHDNTETPLRVLLGLLQEPTCQPQDTSLEISLPSPGDSPIDLHLALLDRPMGPSNL